MFRVRNDVSYLADRSVRPSFHQLDQDRFLRQRYAMSDTLHWKNLVGHYGCVNAIEFSHGLGKFVASGGDDRRVLLWDVEKALSDIGKPSAMRGEHNSNIFCVAFDITNKTIYSGGNDEQVIVHDLTTGETKDVISHEDAVYGLSPDPSNPHVFATSCDDGRILIFDTRDTCAESFCLANYTSSMHSVMYNPVEPRLLATANAKEGVGLWDVRRPRSCLLRYGGSFVQQSCMSVKFNQHGDYLVALRRRLPPVLYNISSHQPVCEFDHSGYYNSCTMKSICFAGDNDQYVLSGSDEFNLYMWALPDDLSERSYINSAHMVLKGHRSIVNQVRFNPANHLIMSSGVEKIIKVWSPFKLPEKQKTEETLQERRVYSQEEYINLVLQNGNVMSHDYSQESTEEDPRMMAFFDSLVQRELDGWSSDDSMSSNEEALYSRIIQLSQSDIDSDDSLPDLGQNDIDYPAYSPFTFAFASVMASQAAEGNDSFPRLNRALENAERVHTEDNADHEIVPSSGDTVAQGLDSQNTRRRSHSEERSTSIGLTELVKRKKREIEEGMKRRAKYPLAEMCASDSDDSCDSDELNESPVSDLNIVIGGNSKSKVKELKKIEDNKAIVGSKHNQDKLQRLKNFRKSVLSSDSNSNDLEILEKKLNSEMFEASSKVPEIGEKFEKVQFKKFKRKGVCGSGKAKMQELKSKEEAKTRANTELGPFLQKAGESTSIDVRKSTSEKGNSSHRGKHSSDSFSFKGKHRSRSSNQHHHLEKSEHHRTSDSECSEFKNIHRKKERFKSYKSDRKDSSYRGDHGERKYDHHGKTDRHEGEKFHKGKSHRHDVTEHRKHHHKDGSNKETDKYRDNVFAKESKDGKCSERLKHDDRNYSCTNVRSERYSNHRRRSISGSSKSVDSDDPQCKLHSEEEESIQKVCDRANEDEIVTKKECKNSKQSRCHHMLGNEHQCGYSEGCSRCKKPKLDKKHECDRVDDTKACTVDKNCFVKEVASDKKLTDRETSLTDQFCKKCARLCVDGKEECYNDKNTITGNEVCRSCTVNKKDTFPAVEKVDQKQLEIQSEFVEEVKDQQKAINLQEVAGNDKRADVEPSCSYQINSYKKMKYEHGESKTHESTDENLKSEDTSPDSINVHYSDGHGKHDENLKSEDTSPDSINMHSNDGHGKSDDSHHTRRSSSSTDEDQLTWVEFKRFKNRLDRAQKRYEKEKHYRRSKNEFN